MDKNHPFYGKTLTKEHRENISKSHKGLQAGEKNPFFGKHHTEETKRKITEMRNARISWLPEKQLLKLYWQDHKSLREMAEIIGRSDSVIKYHMQHYGIERRTISEATQGRIPYNKGKTGLFKHTEATKLQMSLAKKGKSLSEEHKARLKEINTGKNNPMYGKTGKLAPWFGRSHTDAYKKEMSDMMQGHPVSEETRKKLRETHEGRFTGEQNPNWKGGVCSLYHLIRSSKKYKTWAKTILIRDNFRCRSCSKKGGNLHAHHRYPFARLIQDYKITSLKEAFQTEELWDLDIGITLCVPCHIKTFKKVKIISPFSVR